MAKAGIRLAFTAYSRRDPVTGTVKTFLRSAHSRQTSERLKRFQACVANEMRGFRATGATPAERARSIRNSFAQAARSCSGRA